MTEYGYDASDDRSFGGVGGTAKAQALVNITGAAVSAALVLGMGMWGYKLLMRDVSGVPVIEAIEGAFRTQPDDPGGMTAPHQGLHVNEIAAVGSAAGPVDEVRLAPEVVAPADGDAPWGDLIGQAQEAETTPAPQIDSPYADAVADAQTGSEAADAETMLGTADTVEDTPEDADPIDIAIAEALTAHGDTPPLVEDAPFVAIRPAPRPVRRTVATTQTSATPVSPQQAVPGVTDVTQTAAFAPSVGAEVLIDDLPKGTRLVQLGAYASTDVARAEWARIGGKFAEYFDGKRMVVQQAVSGGKIFYRLRAEGFQDLAEARRFCSALTAAQADCIPVEVR